MFVSNRLKDIYSYCVRKGKKMDIKYFILFYERLELGRGVRSAMLALPPLWRRRLGRVSGFNFVSTSAVALPLCCIVSLFMMNDC